VSLTGFFLDLNGLQLNQFVSVGGLGFFAAISNAGKLQTTAPNCRLKRPLRLISISVGPIRGSTQPSRIR